MKKHVRAPLAATALLLAAVASPGRVEAGNAETSRFDTLANAPFEQNRPTAETRQTLMDELAFQQATQAYLWALPLINTLGMKFGSEKVFGAGYNVLPVWKERLDTKTLVTTPNSDVIYAMGYVDMGKTGPIVFEAPPNLQGILLDFWQRPIPVGRREVQGRRGLAWTGRRQRRQVPRSATWLQRRRPRGLLHLSLGYEQPLHLPARLLPRSERP
jgi:hypothetical protein